LRERGAVGEAVGLRRRSDRGGGERGEAVRSQKYYILTTHHTTLVRVGLGHRERVDSFGAMRDDARRGFLVSHDTLSRR
jgi:hypothetical protein